MKTRKTRWFLGMSLTALLFVGAPAAYAQSEDTQPPTEPITTTTPEYNWENCESTSNPYKAFSEIQEYTRYNQFRLEYRLSCYKSPEWSGTWYGNWGGYNNGAINPNDLTPVLESRWLLRDDAAVAFEAMNAAYKEETGKDLQVNSAYRSYVQQKTTFWESPDVAAFPGTSGHGWGTSLDLATAGDYEDQGAWLEEHSEEFGWINPEWAHDGEAPEEPWHFDFQESSHPQLCLDGMDSCQIL